VRTNKFVVLGAVLAIALGASSAMAAGAKKTTGTIKGSLVPANVSPGACASATDAHGNSDSYSEICGNSVKCSCLNAGPFLLTGGFGSGSAKLLVSIDYDPAVETDSDQKDLASCAPAFGVITFVIAARGKTAGRTQTLHALGAICGSPGKTVVSALGGFTIAASSANPPTTGSGTFNGTVDTVGGTTITVTGLIANP
jgi:hypothetical protein